MQTLAAHDFVLTEKEFSVISQLVYDHCGINLHVGKKELVRARLAKRLREKQFDTFSEYIKYVVADASGVEFSIFIDSLSTNLTSFFREPQHFEFLHSDFLPSLLKKKRKARDFKIRAWSAGCSSGEEPYTIAIILHEAIEDFEQWDVKILATDISTSILEVAKDGVYSNEKVAPIQSSHKKKYLTSRYINGKTVFETGQSLKDIIVFKYLNLMQEWPIKVPLDFIFCRNVMIYFDKATQGRLINRFWNILNPGGILFTGHSESLTGIEHRFEYVQPTIYIKP